MKPRIKPERLHPGDIVAAVSLSWKIAGEPQQRWRQERGKAWLEHTLGLPVVQMLKGTELFPSVEEFQDAILLLEAWDSNPSSAELRG
jgi:hypothetical protein